MQPTNYDSEFCGNLPIHLTNLIQPYGVLLVVDILSWEIIQVSENTNTIFTKPASEVVNTNLKSYLNEKHFKILQEKVKNPIMESFPAVWGINGVHLLALIHPKEKYLLIEIDIERLTLGEQESFIEAYQEVKYAMAAIEASTTLEETCKVAANELKRISGFDKVMIYRFDSEWNGTVLAELCEEDMESYLHFTFPASDIPKQARQLYLKNPYRFIPDRDYKPVKLYPVINPISSTFLDLSDCNVRSVAAVHLEYLKNMGVAASMSTRILKDDELWGLIACHHKTPKYLSYEMCSIFEMISSIISVKIASLQHQAHHAIETSMASTYSQLIRSIFKTADLDSSLLTQNGILRLFSATGAVVSRNGKFATIGETPKPEQLDELLLWLHTRQLKKVYYSEMLSHEYDYAKEYADIASGVLVIPIDYKKDHYVILFRAERVKVINWGGNPADRIQFEKDQKNYHPRNSFKQWQEKVRGVSMPWHNAEIGTAETLRSFINDYETSVIM